MKYKFIAHSGSGAPSNAIEISTHSSGLPREFSAFIAKFNSDIVLTLPHNPASKIPDIVRIPAGTNIETAFQTYVKKSKKGAPPADKTLCTNEAYQLLWDTWAKSNMPKIKQLGLLALRKSPNSSNPVGILSDKFAKPGNASQAVALAKILSEINFDDLGVTLQLNTINRQTFNGRLIMGAGVAKYFATKYPTLPTLLGKHIAKFPVGSVIYVNISPNLMVANCITKEHWKNPSQMEWVDACIVNLAKFVIHNPVAVIQAVPLGCGLGGLNRQEVIPKMVNTLGKYTNISFVEYR